MLKKLLIILCLTSMFCIQINALANPANTPNTQQGAVDQDTQSKYETLRNSLIPKQEDFIQHSKNLDTINPDKKLDADEKQQIVFTEGDLETEILPRIIKIITYSSFLIFTGIFIYAGARLLTSYGDEAVYTEVKNLILNTIIGVAIILSSYAIIYGVIQILKNIKTS